MAIHPGLFVYFSFATLTVVAATVPPRLVGFVLLILLLLVKTSSIATHTTSYATWADNWPRPSPKH